MSNSKKIINSVAWSGIESWGNKFISIAVFLLLARLVGPEDFGIVATALIFINFISIFLDQGFSESVVQRKQINDIYLNTAFWINTSISLVLVSLTILSSKWIASFFNQQDLASIIRWISLSFLLSGISKTQEAILVKSMNFKILSIRSLVASIISGSVGITLAVTGFGVWSLVFKELTFHFTKTVLIWGMSTWRPGIIVSREYAKELFSFGSNVVGFRLFNQFYRQADNFIISYFLGSTALGFYTVGYRLLQTLSELFSGIIQKVALSAFSRIQSDLERLKKEFLIATKLTSLTSFPIFITISILSPEIVLFLFGYNWAQSIPVMRILAFVGIQYSVTCFNASILMAMGKPSWVLRLRIFESLVVITGFILGVKWGLIGIATSLVITTYSLSPIGLTIVGKQLGFNFLTYISQFSRVFAATAIMSVIMILVKSLALNLWIDINYLATIAIVSICGFSVYLPLVFILDREFSRYLYSLLFKKAAGSV